MSIFTVPHIYGLNYALLPFEPISAHDQIGTDFRHRCGIFGGESQTSFTRNATRAGSEEGRLFSQAKGKWDLAGPREDQV